MDIIIRGVRNSISSGHYILSTIHADKAASIPNRMYSLLETNQDIEQFLKSIHSYVQIGVYIRGYMDKRTHSFHREIAEVTEFYVSDDNKAESNTIYQRSTTGHVVRKAPSKYLIDYLDEQGVTLSKDAIHEGESLAKNAQIVVDENYNVQSASEINNAQPTQQVVTPTVNVQTRTQTVNPNMNVGQVANPFVQQNTVMQNIKSDQTQNN